MHKAGSLLFAILFTAMAILTISPHVDAKKLRLHNQNITPDTEQILPTNNDLQIEYCIVQFTGPVHEQWKSELTRIGVDILDYVPDFAFICRTKNKNTGTILSFPFVSSITPLSPEFIISSAAMELATSGSGDKTFVITTFKNEDAERICTAITALGGVINSVSNSGSTHFIEINIESTQLYPVAKIAGIKWISTPIEITFNNDTASLITGARGVGADLGYYGEGQTVAVLDSGLCGGDINNLHPDFSDGNGGNRVAVLIAAIFNTTGRLDDYNGHGTHVAGTVLGNGIMSGAKPAENSFPDTCYAGIAPKATLIFQAAFGEQHSYATADYLATYTQAYDLNARISTTSLRFNSDVSRIIDNYLFNKKDFLTITAAGNRGTDANRDGIIDKSSINPDSTAKNMIIVGASESYRPSENIKWPDFSNPGSIGWTLSMPVLTDYRANCTVGVAAFSSRGPTLDGRYKPDILAPASSVMSTTYENWETAPYVNKAGTSMAAPQVAGAAALVREYLQKEKGMNTPSAALMKAILLNSAKDMGNGQYGSGEYREILSVPNSVCGWGLLNVREALSPKSPFAINYYDMTSETVTTGYSKSFTFDVQDSSRPLKAHLVWTDQAGSEISNNSLVNDLDLMARSPSGQIHYPNNARLPLETSATVSYPSDGGSEPLAAGKGLLVELPAFPDDISGFSKITIPLSAPLAENTLISVTIMVLDGEEFYGISGYHDQFAQGSTELVFTGYQPCPTSKSKKMYLRLQPLLYNIEFKTTSASPATNQRYIYQSSLGQSTIEKTALKPFQVDIETYKYPTSNSFDRVNNAVGIIVDKPEKGRWTFTVQGYNIPDGPQPYALVISGLNGEIPSSVAPITAKPQTVPDTTILSQSTEPLGATELESRYQINSVSPVGEKIDSTMTINPAAGQDSLASFSYPITADRDRKVSTFKLLKLKDDNTTLDFTYSDFGTFNDGNWWLSDLTGNVLTTDESVSADSTYMVNIVVEDNGNFDLNSTVNAIRDPSLLTASGTASGATGSSGGSTGCTLSTGSSGGTEIILLLIAAIGYLARRHKQF
ncbi:S8 family serine peptidase [Maridesulfovibrio sp.]|uniref:S8 family serine peptidase n=1 Tax=Maridesulfovibrio sp. TaxID=2795000 RepID=UPI002AA82DF2|nr:S8 family serine peptidase [Maridesulfovibrio sp.]